MPPFALSQAKSPNPYSDVKKANAFSRLAPDAAISQICLLISTAYRSSRRFTKMRTQFRNGEINLCVDEAVWIAKCGVLMLSSKTPVPASDAIDRFLGSMAVAAQESFPEWKSRLQEGLEECFPSDGEALRRILEQQPLSDYFFAGVVGMEASRIRAHFGPAAASVLLARLADDVDAAAGRDDRVVSDFVFFAVGRIDLETGIERMRMPYDLVVLMLLEKIGIGSSASTRPLLFDFVFKHNLGEPLARGVPNWWKNFAGEFAINGCEEAPLPEAKSA